MDVFFLLVKTILKKYSYMILNLTVLKITYEN